MSKQKDYCRMEATRESELDKYSQFEKKAPDGCRQKNCAGCDNHAKQCPLQELALEKLMASGRDQMAIPYQA
jgi:hypothetical protein